MSAGALVLLAILVAMVGGFVLFYLYSRTPAWRASDTRMALVQVLIVVGPMFGMRFDKPPPDRPAVMGGLGYCNITKCCTEVCPEHIHITDNAIIPLKERVADRRWDPVRAVTRRLSGRR